MSVQRRAWSAGKTGIPAILCQLLAFLDTVLVDCGQLINLELLDLDVISFLGTINRFGISVIFIRPSRAGHCQAI